MKLFIPELGTKLQLTKDWVANVRHEGRNLSVLDVYGPQDYLSNSLKEKNAQDLAEIASKKRNFVSRTVSLGTTGNSYTLRELVKDKNSEDFEKLAKEASKVWYDNYQKSYQVKFKKGLILEVDRIYIRQGNARCSSVTFKIRDKKVLRFWVKLDEVNQIDCKVIGKPEENRFKNIARCSIGG